MTYIILQKLMEVNFLVYKIMQREGSVISWPVGGGGGVLGIFTNIGYFHADDGLHSRFT